MNKSFFSVIFGALILSQNAFHNRFPLLTTDSGSYISSGFSTAVPRGGTALYGYFIAHTSWGFSTWLVIFSQSFILSLVIFYYFRALPHGYRYRTYYLAFIFFISFAMGASVNASTVDPGVFTTIAVLSMGLLLFAQNLSQRDMGIIGLTLVLSVGTAFTNVLYAFIIVICLSIKMLFLPPSSVVKRMGWNRILGCSIITLLTCALFFALNSWRAINLPESLSEGHFQKVGSYLISPYPSAGKNPQTFEALRHWFNWELREASLSQQYFEGIEFNFISWIQMTFSTICIAFFVYAGIIKRLKIDYSQFSFFLASIAILLLVNAFTSTSTNCFPQLIWLLMLPAFLFITNNSFSNATFLKHLKP